MPTEHYVSPQTVNEALRLLSGGAYGRTGRAALIGFLALKAKETGLGEPIEVKVAGDESVEVELNRYFGVAPNSPHPFLNPFGKREGRVEYLGPDYRRHGVYTHLSPGRTLAQFLDVRKGANSQIVTIPADAAEKIAGKLGPRLPLEPTAAFLLRNEQFGADADTGLLVDRLRQLFHLTDRDMAALFTSTPAFPVEWGDAPYSSADIPLDLAPPLASSSHAAAAHASTMIEVAPRSSVALVMDENVRRRVCRAMATKKAVALAGPPGSAKSWLLEDILEEATGDPGILGLEEPPTYDRHTAEVDWTARTIIGGYYPQEDGRLVFQEGLLLRAIREGRMLWIEEMNRADLDRVLGPVLTFLAEQRVDLGPTHLAQSVRAAKAPAEEAKSMSLQWAEGPKSGVKEDDRHRIYYAGTDWRIIGTYNNVDLGRVFPMGSALLRRWAIVPVSPIAPEQIPQILNQIEGVSAVAADTIARLYSLHLRTLPIGPAPFVDMAKYVAQPEQSGGGDEPLYLRDAYILFMGQQLKRLDPNRRTDFMTGLTGILGPDLTDELDRL